MNDIEAIVWCPCCQVDKFTIYRKKVREGVYVNRRDPDTDEVKVCKDCGEILERHE